MSNSILPAAGNLDIVNANVRADKFNAATNIGVSNSAPTKNFSVGDKFHVDKDSVDPVSITGNVVASGIKISNLTISPAFDFASVSNVGNVTANVIQFANATTGFTTTANVEIGGNITLTSNAQVKVGSNVLAEYTGPHGREPKEMPLKKFPEIAFDASKLDGNDTTNTYTQAGYNVTVSSSAFEGDGFVPWKVFNQDNGKTGNNGWHTAGNPAAVSGSPYNTIDSSYVGEWLKIELPNAIKLSHVSIASRKGYASTQAPAKYRIYGSNNDSTWIELIDADNLVYTDEVFTTKFSTTTNYYKYLALVIQRATAPQGNFSCTIGEIQYYGYEEPAPPGDLSLDTTLKSTFNSVRSNNYVMYFDGEDPAAGNVPKYLPSGSAKSITPNNVVFDATNNCWTLNGSTESNVTTGSLGFEGDVPHTVSTWINASNLEANALTQQLFSIGSGYSEEIVRVDDTQIAANTWHNVTYAYQGEGGSKVTYVDGRKVEEAQVEDTFGAYPPLEMTGYKVGGYCVSASSEHDNGVRLSWKAFESGTGNETGLFMFNETGPKYGPTATTSAALFEGVRGEWIKLELPEKIYINYLFLRGAQGTSQSPEQIRILGSNDDVNWDVVKDTFTVSNPAGDSNDAINSSKAYKYIVLQVIKVNGSNAVQIKQILYYGHKEGDLTRFPEPTRVLKYPHILTKNGTGDGFTSATSAPEYGKRGYVIKASSSIGSYPPYAAFNGETHVATGTTWIGGFNSYGTNNSGVSVAGGYKTTGAMNLKTNLGTGGSATSNGEWLYIEMPHKIKVTSTKIISNDGVGYPPDYLIIYGTNDPSSSGGWVVVDDTYDNSSSGIINNATGKTWAVSTASSPVAYKYFALVIVKVNSSATFSHALVTDWQLLGTQENTGTPAIVGGPFAGKVANFRVYDQYLGDERIQEIYDAQKDEFGHKKSSMTFYKGRIGVGTTEPEGALTVVDEPHAVAKFPARAVSADDSYVEGDGQIKLSAADGSGYQAFDGLTSTSWTATPTRNTRLSEEVDFGAWLKIQTPESMSLKKAEIESKPDWAQVGTETYGGSIDNTTSGVHFGRAVACSHDGTRVIVGGYVYNNNQGLVKVYDWNGSSWTQVGSTLTGIAANDLFGRSVAISGDGNIIAVAAPREHSNGIVDSGSVRVYYLDASTGWTILPDSGPHTLSVGASNVLDAFVGQGVDYRMGQGGVKLSYDGKTLLLGEAKYDSGGLTNRGLVRVFTYTNGAWSQKGDDLLGDYTQEEFGQGLDMSEDGNHLIIGTKLQGGTSQPPRVEVYRWTGSAWAQKGSSITYADTADGFGPSVSISTDGNTIGVGIKNADAADGASADNAGVVYVYHWSGSAWGTPHKLIQPVTDDDDFGDHQVMSGDGKRIIVGASHADDGGTNSGRLYTFEYTGGSWVLREVPSVGADGGTNAYLGMGPSNSAHSHAISRDGSVIVAGESGFYTNGQAYSGRVRIYNMPSTIKSIWGSNDDVNWTKITTAPTREEATSNVAGLAFGYDDRLEFKNLDNPNYYKYHAIVADAFTRLKDVKLFGVRNQGSSTLHDGALTLTKNLDVPRIGPPLDADDTPRRDRLVVEYNTSTNPMEDGLVQDTSGKGNDGFMYGNTYYDATEKAFEFDGTDDMLDIPVPRHMIGDPEATVSIWVKPTSLTTSGSDWDMFVHIGRNVNSAQVQLTYNGSTKLHIGGYDQNIRITGDYPLAVGTWYHLCMTVNPGAWSTTTKKLYVNGQQITNTYLENSGTTNIPDHPQSRISFGALRGTGGAIEHESHCKMSNMKVYDTVLTAQEVKTLYDMGRCDEGGHIVNFSKTRVGIGLGGGEAPLAALDSRDTRLAFKYGGTTLDNFEEYVHGGPWSGQHSNGSGGFNVHGPIKYQRIGTFCRAHFDYVQYYANGTFYMKADNVPERFRPITGGDIMTWYTRVYTNGPISSLSYYDPGNTRWVITSSVNGSNFNGGNGTNHSIISTSITYRVA